MTAAFKAEKVRFASGATIEHEPGWTYNHLGLLRSGPFMAPIWTIVHLNSGHSIGVIKGTTRGLEQMQDMVAEIADAGDWSFDGLDGFRNQFPDAPDRVREIITRHIGSAKVVATGASPNPVAARTVALLREDELHPRPVE